MGRDYEATHEVNMPQLGGGESSQRHEGERDEWPEQQGVRGVTEVIGDRMERAPARSTCRDLANRAAFEASNGFRRIALKPSVAYETIAQTGLGSGAGRSDNIGKAAPGE